MSRLRIATRQSPLALAQARLVARRIGEVLEVECELLPLRTSGDRLKGRLDKLGGKGLFVKEVEEAVLAGRADLAVHSGKDLPAISAAGLVLAAIPERADPRDALVARAHGETILGLPRGARVGTGSVRRTAQLLARRPDLQVVPLRGNVETRLLKIVEDELAGVILACAGLERLGLGDRIHERIAPEVMLPAVNQGALALQTRVESAVAADLQALSDPDAAACFRAERAFLVRLEGSCNLPLAALAERLPEERLSLRGLVAAPDGARLVQGALSAPLDQAESLGGALADRLRAEGGDAILGSLAQEASA